MFSRIVWLLTMGQNSAKFFTNVALQQKATECSETAYSSVRVRYDHVMHTVSRKYLYQNMIWSRADVSGATHMTSMRVSSFGAEWLMDDF